MADIDSPPAGSIPGDDRDKEAYQALEPHVAALARVAVETGCHETEVIAVLVSWALDRAIEGAGL
jgi:hypothetical protein